MPGDETVRLSRQQATWDSFAPFIAARAAFFNSLLGWYYSMGIGVARSDGIAFHWDRLAAAQDQKFAENDLGYFYLNGRGVAKDPGIAALWFRRSAEQGVAVAEWRLGMLYIEGNGVPLDCMRGISLVERAAAAGEARAKRSLHDRAGFGACPLRQ